jgi:hypothetical protein
MDIVETAQSLNAEKLPDIQNDQIMKVNITTNQQKGPLPQITDNTTTISNLNFLKTSNKDQIIEKLNEDIPKDTISTSTGTSSNNSQQGMNSKIFSKKKFCWKNKRMGREYVEFFEEYKIEEYVSKSRI